MERWHGSAAQVKSAGTRSEQDLADVSLHARYGNQLLSLSDLTNISRSVAKAATNGAQVEEDSARPDRLAMPARAAYARTPFLVYSNRACLHRYSGLPDPGKPHRKFSGNHGWAGGRQETGGCFDFHPAGGCESRRTHHEEAGSPSCLNSCCALC